MTLLSLTQIVDSVRDLPTPPVVVMDILNNIDKDDLDISELTAKVNQDPALTAKTLRIANSAYYASMVKVTTLQQAVSLLGISSLRQIILNVALSGCFPENNCAGFSHTDFWKHSNAVAQIAKLLARRVSFNQDIAYTAGLLHDIGILVLVTRHSQAYQQVLQWQLAQQSATLSAERAVTGTDHCIAGRELGLHWNFSDPIVNAISGHHDPLQPGLGFLAGLVHAADALAHHPGATPQALVLPDAILNSLHLDCSSLSSLQLQAEEILLALNNNLEM